MTLTAVLAVAALLAVIPSAARSEDAATAVDPQPASAKPRADASYYLPMRDGVRIALSVWFPGGKPPARPAPVLLVQTRYGRTSIFLDGEAGGGYRQFVDAGYVVAVVDTRGSTASFGPRDVDIGPDQVRDIDEIIAHLAAQPWSNSSVYVTGVSYMADTADVSTSRAAPALKGGVIREADFDVWAHLFLPGGVRNDWFLNTWGDATYRMDLGLGDDPTSNLDCRARATDCLVLWPVLDPVDGDADYTLLRQALAGKRRWTPRTYATTEFRDDIAGNGSALFASSPAAHLADIRRRALPVQYWGGWMDGGTAEAALARYRSAPEVPMEVWITANNHQNTVGADPFFPDDRAPRPAVDAQVATIKDFLARVDRGQRIERRIRYYVLGSGQFKETAVWPPADAHAAVFALGHDRKLLAEPPARRSVEGYEVDFTASTGANTRWSTQFGIDPGYRDRRAEDRKLLTYDSTPFGEDMELVGTPVLKLEIATRTPDPALHAYLEDVAPDGTVTYLTEGSFRLLHRKLADAATLPYDPGPAPHSFRRADAQPVVPGEFARVEFALFPVAARIAAGHRLRLAIAGADADTFRRHSLGRPEQFSIASGGERASLLTVTLRPWRAD